MSPSLIGRSPDLLALQDEGYFIRVVDRRYLVVDEVRYLDKDQQVQTGSLVTELQLAGERTVQPSDHVVRWAGSYPFDSDGRELEPLRHGSGEERLGEDLTVRHSFSARPRDGFRDYHHKMSNYVAIIEAPVNRLYPGMPSRTTRVEQVAIEVSPFMYADTASSRAGIVGLNAKVSRKRIGIVGVGGTGSYVLDMLAKTEVGEIHLFDGDHFENHNAFRAPGAAGVEDLNAHPLKVDHFKAQYSRMHRGVHSHAVYLDESNVSLLGSLDFVFLCVDAGPTRPVVAAFLENAGIPFIDVGIGVTRGEDSLLGVVRVTTSSKDLSIMGTRAHRLPAISSEINEDYERGVQVAEVNALGAVLAVLRWKRLVGFYHSDEDEHNSTFVVSGNTLISEDYPATIPRS